MLHYVIFGVFIPFFVFRLLCLSSTMFGRYTVLIFFIVFSAVAGMV